MSVVRFRDAFEELRLANPNQPIGLVIPKAIGCVVLGPENMEQAGNIQVTPADRISFTLGPSWLRLWVNGDWTGDYHNIPHFSSNLSFGEETPNIRFSVRNTLAPYSSETHPFIYASKLLDAGIKYHERQLSRPLEGLTGSWEPDSDSVNYIAYQAARSKDATETEAAFVTWTGDQAKKHDFNRVTIEVAPDENNKIYAHFKREPTE